MVLSRLIRPLDLVLVGSRVESCHSLSGTPVRQTTDITKLGPNMRIRRASLLGRKRGIFVLVADNFARDNSAVNTEINLRKRSPRSAS
jgi:hypothetical protein